MRGRSYSYSPSPPRGYSRRRRSPSPSLRNGYGRRGRDLPTSLLVRNLSRDCRPEDLRGPFGEFGPLKDIYLPRDYYTGEPRGFGFVQYVDPYDAEEAKYQMDGQAFLGRRLTVVFAERNRKKPLEMRARERLRSRSHDRRWSPVGHSRSRSSSRSPAHYRRSIYPRTDYYDTPSPPRRSGTSRVYKYRERSYSRSPYGSRSRSLSGGRSSRSRSCSRSRSYSAQGYST